jgi:hypothetical protein
MAAVHRDAGWRGRNGALHRAYQVKAIITPARRPVGVAEPLEPRRQPLRRCSRMARPMVPAELSCSRGHGRPHSAGVRISLPRPILA